MRQAPYSNDPASSGPLHQASRHRLSGQWASPEAPPRRGWLPRAWLAVLLVLGACGGGGGGEPTAGSVDTGDGSAAAGVTPVGGTSSTLPAGSGSVGSTPPTTTAGSTAGTTTGATGSSGTGASAGTAGATSRLGPTQLAVLIADGDATSEAIARAYQLARGVPEANLVRLTVPTGSDSISASDFAVLKARLDALLPAQVQATLVTWTQPSRVQGSCAMSLTSALAFGYDDRFCGQCSRTLASTYFNSSSRQPWTDLGMRPSMMLGAASLGDAQALIARGLAAEGAMTRSALTGAGTGTGWLVRSNDAARSVRYADFLALAATPVAGVAWQYVDNAAGTGSSLVADQSDVMFYFTGLSRVAQAASNRYLPGAVADHLTSFAGVLPGANGQMPATDWLAAGATGSFGTVEEPCNYTEKFPQASVLVNHYSRGQTLLEAYWKSVQWPGQGLFVGEPLARPWAAI